MCVTKLERGTIAARTNELYANLFQKAAWGKTKSEFRMELPDERFVSNVNIVPFMKKECVVIRLDNGAWELPGGTLERGEDYLTAIKRELMEEAGAVLRTFEPFGAWKCFSHLAHAYKPHLPHPEFYRLVGYGDVELTAVPQIPVDGENVIAVETMSVEEATAAFRETGRPDLAELYVLAEELRNAKRDQGRNEERELGSN